MLVIDRIRYRLIDIRSRFAADAARRGEETVHLLADAMTEERRMTGGATTGDLETRYGFSRDELAAHAQRAIDMATLRHVRGGILDPATGF